MATNVASGTIPALRPRAALRPAGALATAAVLAAVAMAVSVQVPAPTPLVAIAVVGVFSAAIAMLFSERYGWSLAILMLYLGLADGFLKLSTDSSQITLVRDLLLWAIAGGALIRIAVRQQAVSFPPLTGWVIAWLVVVAVQVANPGNGTLLHSVASVRPHAEWVPLFFFGYLLLREKERIRVFLVLMLVVAAANGVVGLIQQNITPEQLASWGTGYEKALKGESTVSQRSFSDEEGNERNRPFGLGGDVGFGGALGVMAIPAALALLSLSLPPWLRLLVIALSIGVVLAVITSAARVHIISSVVALLAFAGLTVSSRGGLRAVLGIAVGLAIAYAAVSFVTSGSETGAFDRFATIDSPAEALSTGATRSGVLGKVPDYIREIPLGAGIGSKGPAGSFGGGGGGKGLNAESEPTFLLIELGIPGLAVMLGFNLVLLGLSITRIRRVGDRETRLLLTAIAVPLFSMFAGWSVGVSTATTPGAPYLWFAAGVLAYWLLGPGLGERPTGRGRASPSGWQARWSTA